MITDVGGPTLFATLFAFRLGPFRQFSLFTTFRKKNMPGGMLTCRTFEKASLRNLHEHGLLAESHVAGLRLKSVAASKPTRFESWPLEAYFASCWGII